MAHDVFVSFSSKDKAVADAIVAAMENNQIRCWYASRDIKPGEDWGQAIVKAIEKCKVFFIIFSGNANHSQHVLDEVNLAISQQAVLLPFRIENLEPEGAMKLHLSSRHWLDAYDPSWQSHIKKLIKHVSANLDAGINEADIVVPESVLKGKKGKRRLIRTTAGIVMGAILIAAGWLGWSLMKNDLSKTPTQIEMSTITPVPKMPTVTPLVPVKSETGRYPFMALDCNNQPITQEIIDQIEISTELLVPDAKTVWYDGFDCDRISEYYWEVLIESPSGYANVSDSKAILYSSPETGQHQITALYTLNENISNNEGVLILFNYTPDISEGGFNLSSGDHPTENFRIISVHFTEFKLIIDGIHGDGDIVFEQLLSVTKPYTDYYLFVHITNDSAFEIQLWSKEQPDEIVTTQIPAFDSTWEDLNWAAQIYTLDGTVELMEYYELVF